MRILATIVIISLIAVGIVACGDDSTEPATGATSPAVEATQVPTVVPDTPTPRPSATTPPANTPTPTSRPEPTSPPPTAVPTVAPEPTATSTPEPTVAPTPEPAATATPMPTAVASPTSAPEPTSVPEEAPIVADLAPLGDSLLWVAHFDNATKLWSVYDPSGTFSPDMLPLVGQDVPDASSIGELSALDTRQIYWLMVSEAQTAVLGGVSRTLVLGLNGVPW